MHLLIVTYHLVGVTDAEYRRGCEGEAAAFASVPGLASKVWLANAETNTYGGVYTFTSLAALDAYLSGELYAALRDDPTITNLLSTSFELLEAPSRATRGIPAVAT
jgi:hypothetical protein